MVQRYPVEDKNEIRKPLAEMGKIIDVTNWQELQWYNTGGTRAKKFLSSPDDITYFFKKSDRKYPYEFWSEIIASGLGKLLKLDVLQYDIALLAGELGCISQNMLKTTKQELVEGGKLMQAFDTTFQPDDKKLRRKYTFQLIENTFKAYQLENHLNKIFEMMVFDLLIGNSDRHQENWAFIGDYSLLSQSINQIEYAAKSPLEFAKLPKWLQGLVSFLKKQNGEGALLQVKLALHKNVTFAPIYDNGSSLCRECTTEKITHMLKDKNEFEAYINRGHSEIHWEENKISHFELIKNLLKSEHKDRVYKIISRVIRPYSQIDFEKFMEGFDGDIPEEKYGNIKLPKERKELITKAVSLRAQKLQGLL